MTDRKLQVLSDIARLFADEGIVWGVGASLLLWHHGVTDRFSDIDFVVVPEHALRADVLLSARGKKSFRESSEYYFTEYFFEYTLDGVDLDLMSGFGIRNYGCRYLYDFSAASVVEFADIGGVRVPFTALESWYVLYAMMPNREQRLAQLEQYFRDHGIRHSALLQEALDSENLPQPIKNRVRDLMDSCRMIDSL